MLVAQFLLIHRRVRASRDRGNRLAGNGNRGPDAQGRADRVTGYVDRFGGTTANLLGDLGEFIDAVDVGQQDEDLVAPGTPDRVPGADAFADPFRQGWISPV